MDPIKVIQKKIASWWLSFNPSEKHAQSSNWIIFPIFGMKIKHIFQTITTHLAILLVTFFGMVTSRDPLKWLLVGDLQRSGMKLGHEFNHLADFVCFIRSSSHYLQLFFDPRWLAGFLNHQQYFQPPPPFFLLGFDPLTGHPSCCLSQMCYPSNARQALDVHLGDFP